MRMRGLEGLSSAQSSLVSLFSRLCLSGARWSLLRLSATIPLRAHGRMDDASGRQNRFCHLEIAFVPVSWTGGRLQQLDSGTPDVHFVSLRYSGTSASH